MWLYLLSFSLSMFSQIQIGSGTSTTSYIPIRGNYNYSISQQIILKSEYNAGDGVAGNITKIKWFLTTNASAWNSWNEWEVYLGHTNKTSYSSSTDMVNISGATLVFDGIIPMPTNNDWLELTLTTPFNYNDTDNIVLTVVEKSSGWGSSPAFRSFSASNRGLYAYQDAVLTNSRTEITSYSSLYRTRTNDIAQVQIVGQVALCSKVLNLTLDNISTDNATVSWTAITAAQAYEYELRTSGAIGSPTGLVVNGITQDNTPTLDLLNLQPNTTYNLYVRSKCSATEFGRWSDVLAFTTSCLATSIPYVLDINSAVVPNLPSCVIRQDLNNDERTWTTVNTSVGAGFEDAKVIQYTYHGSNAANDWFFTQGLNLVAGQSYRLTYKYRNTGSYVEKLRVSIGDNQINTSMTNQLSSHVTTTTAATYTEVVDFYVPSNGVFYIGFQAYSDANKLYLQVGDIKVETTPTCFVPRNLAVNTSSITQNAVSFNWALPEVAPVNGYEYEIRTSGNPGEVIGRVSTATVAAGTLIATVNGLLPNTDYWIYARSVCVGNDKSIWTSGVKFTTLCQPPVLLNKTDAVLCGFGQATLTANFNEGTVRWFQSENSPTVLGVGSSFTTPEISQTTSYWVSASSGLVSGTVGKIAPSLSETYNGIGTGIAFDVTTDLKLTSVDVYSTSAGTIKVAIVNSAGVELFSTPTINITAGGSTTPNTVSLNYEISPGTGYRMVIKEYSEVNLIRDSSSNTFPYTTTDGSITVTNGWLSSSSTSYYYFYNIGYENGCSSARHEVIATVNPAPAFSLSTEEVSICEGSETNVVTITSGASDYDTFTITPNQNYTGNKTTGWRFSPTVTTEYTIVASQSNGQCVARKRILVKVNSLPTFAVPISPVEICPNTIRELSLENLPPNSVALGTGTSVQTSGYPNPLSGWYGGVKTQILYTKTELEAQGLTAGSMINFLQFDLGAAVARECYDFTIRIGNTTRTTMMSPMVTGLTTVYNASYTPSPSVLRPIFNFTTPFTWDGQSNIIIETVHNAGNSGNGSGTTHKYTTTSFASVYYGASDSTTPRGVASFDARTSYSSSGTSSNRPNIILGLINPVEYTWLPLTGLYTDAAATIPYTGQSVTKVFTNSSVNTLYTVEAKNTLTTCSKSSIIHVNVLELGSFSVEEQMIFCEATNVEDIDIDIIGTGVIKWYSSATSTVELSTITQTGTYYLELVTGTCKTERQSVAIEIVQAAAPIAEEDQYLCEETTLADLQVEIVDNRFESRWYISETSTEALPLTTILTNETTYYVSSYLPQVGCESDRVPVTTHLSTTPAPVALSSQKFCIVDDARVRNLAVTGTAVKWYNASEGGTLYAEDTVLENGRTYYASQVLNNCESEDRTAVRVIVENLNAPTANTTVAYTYGDTPSALIATPDADNISLLWYTRSTGGTSSTTAPTPSTTEVGSQEFWVSQKITNGCESERTKITVTVSKASLVVTANSATKVYGTQDPIITYTATGFKNGDTVSVLRGRLSRATGENVGTYSITIGDLTSSNYTIQLVSDQFVITKAELTLTAENKTKVYGDQDPTLTYTIQGLRNSDTAAVIQGTLARLTGESVGTYPINIGSISTANYNIDFVAGNLIITTAPLTVTAHEKTKVYGSADPVLSFSVTGYKNGDGNSVLSGSITREIGENVGVYAITRGTLAVTSNYQLVVVHSNLTITKADLTIIPVGGQEKVYGNADPIFLYNAVGFKFNDNASIFEGRLGRLQGENVRTYRYDIGGLTTSLGNYRLLVDNQVTFEIKPAALQIVVEQGQSKVYGTADPAFRFSANGLQFDDRAANVVTGSLVRDAGENVGTYPIRQGSLALRSNYYLTSFVGADFRITSSGNHNLRLLPNTFVYDGTPKFLEIVGDLPTNAVVTYTNNGQTNVGAYNVTATINLGSNYDVINLQAELKITQAEQSISFGLLDIMLMDITPTMQLGASASSGLPITYTYRYIDEVEPATVSATGLVTALRPGTMEVIANQDGNANYRPATPVKRLLVVESKEAKVLEFIIDGVSYMNPATNLHIVVGCESIKNKVYIQVIANDGISISPSAFIEVNTLEYGSHQQKVIVTSNDGSTSKEYTITIEKRFVADELVVQKYNNNVLLVNNNPKTNGGYEFTGYIWYKDGVEIGRKQMYSAGDNKGDELDPNAVYHVELLTKYGKKLVSCPITIKAKPSTELQVYPNPIVRNQALNVVMKHQEEVKIVNYAVYNLVGQMIAVGEFTGDRTLINLPSNISVGSYFLILKVDGKHQSVQFIVKE